ncbi:BON domain-containing protein [Motiliproteus sp. MSK22-1]|uniref:BON domain-containing protein n=1 Tax=Motiliproteus sp. MSK22-1 TaxID=1897630 RepID=UPI000976F099|nr:BON domain-containing protein [Motiliproteus sp. MSK22-1]OMH33623.1 hypothetical protein BGP75_11420 [Motiliproteus sp. MSK22-1]
MNKFAVKPLVAACAIALAATAAPVLADSGADRSSDVWSKASLATTYTLNRHLNPFDIDTEVKNGVATLRGEVESDIERHLAEELALGIDGIHKVNNELIVNPQAKRLESAKDSKEAKRTFGQKVEDANLTARIKSQLLWNTSTEGLAINVDTRNKVVTLSGDVESEAESELAELIALNTGEVLEVKNQLKVVGEKTSLDEKVAQESREAAQTVSDSWITTKVKSMLIYNRNVDGVDIDVSTQKGVVTLRGRVDSEFERKLAISIAEGVKGVKSVSSELQGA